MKITIENTSKVVHLNNVPARLWTGTTEDGIPVICFISRIAVNGSEDDAVHERFRTELAEQKAPTAEVEAIPLRLII